MTAEDLRLSGIHALAILLDRPASEWTGYDHIAARMGISWERAQIIGQHLVGAGLAELYPNTENILGTPPDPFYRATEKSRLGIVRHGFDIGGVLSKYPDILRPTVLALLSVPGIEVHVLTDMPDHGKAVDMVHRNGFPVPADRIHSCDYETHGEECKAVKAREIGLHVLWDDFMGYVDTVGAPPLRLLVMPDATCDYYHEAWETDGSEASFGRRIQRRAKP